MALIGEMKYLQIGSNTYEIPTSELPIASSSTLGGIKVGTNLSIDSSTGVLSASFTETDPVFSASAAHGITQNDIDSWNAKVSDDKTWNGVTLVKQQTINTGDGTYVPLATSTSPINISFTPVKKTPTANAIAKYDASAYLYSTTPSANDNSTKVATTAYVDAAIPTISITRNLTSGTKSATINVDGTDYDIYSVTNTDQNVTQTAVSTSTIAEHRLLLSNSTNDTTETSGVFKAGKLTYSPFYHRLILYPGTSDCGKLRMYYRDGFYFDLEPYGYNGDSSSNYNAIVKFASGSGKDIVLRGIKAPSNDNDATNKLYVDTRSLPTGGTAGQVLKKTSSTNYDVEWGAVDALPVVTSSDNNKVLMVVNGAWAAASLPIYNGGVS